MKTNYDQRYQVLLIQLTCRKRIYFRYFMFVIMHLFMSTSNLKIEILDIYALTKEVSNLDNHLS